MGRAEGQLTAGSVAVASEFALDEVALDARLLPHLADLRHAQLGVGSEVQLPRADGEVVLLPVPQILELLVVERRKGVHAGGGGEREEMMRMGDGAHAIYWGSG